ncbi:MAG: molybdopterin converting factor subunit 1 [Alphaproteobacteria bacterium]
MKLLYFAWLRQKLGQGEERVEPPADVTDVAGLVDWLRARSPAHAAALARMDVVRVAVNQEFAGMDTPVRPGDEVAFFPPVTGG